ncbi:hypothetical protein GCM10007160_43300 [Litchfieldella qijiaojingensis]|uniref:Uncharacterized protein n=1 Tax=Litchfieldella qijiaojingensis TaxID=980347 RepID=A0ABQ2ZC62_9GAMM|nr:hypothetical protein GCM10007160_43300 [Halomonas qijiaojingensis]
MRLVGKAGIQRRLGNGRATFELTLPQLDPAIDQIRMGREPKMLLEGTDEMARAVA